MCVFFRIFVCESRKEKTPIYNGQSYEEIRTYPSNPPDKINNPWEMPFMAHLLGGYGSRKRRHSSQGQHHGRLIRVPVLREAQPPCPQLPMAADPDDGTVVLPCDADAPHTPLPLRKPVLQQEHLFGAACPCRQIRAHEPRGILAHPS